MTRKRLCETTGARCLGGCPCAEHARTAGAGQIEALRTVLRSLISCGGTSPTIKAMAMNTLEPGSGDAWLANRT